MPRLPRRELTSLRQMPILAATPETIAAAADALRSGALVAFPTETVYGLGADATNPLAVAAIFEAKGRPRFNPLIVHVADVAAVDQLAVLDDRAHDLAAAHWPGPLTLVLRKSPGCPVADLATAGLDTIAIRIPAHPVALAMLRAADRPIAAPSANRSGHVSPTLARHVADDLGERVAMIIDGGATPVGVESTVLDLTGPAPVLLRAGGLATQALEAHLGSPLRRRLHDDASPMSPGQLASHYAPRASVRLNVQHAIAGEALLAFGPDAPPHGGPTINLSPTGDLRQAAASLFAALRTLDASGVATIAVMPIPETGLGEAINDRLRRAAVR